MLYYGDITEEGLLEKIHRIPNDFIFQQDAVLAHRDER